MKKSKTLKDFYYLGAKCWNSLPSSIRVKNDVKSFSNSYKAELLSSITSDVNYLINNGYEYMHKVTSVTLNIETIDVETSAILTSINTLFS